MSKTSNFNIAKIIANITGKPIEKFYAPIQKDTQVNIEISSEEDIHKKESLTNIGNTSINVVKFKRDTQASIEDIQALLEKYGGEIVNNKILGGRQMTRSEYLKVKKTIKTADEFWKHPLLYLMFRAEGQNIPGFVEWTTIMQMEFSDEY